LNITCNFLNCNHQVHRYFLITLYIDVAGELKGVPAKYFKIKVTEGFVLLECSVVFAIEYGPARTVQFPVASFLNEAVLFTASWGLSAVPNGRAV
jgi:hypothetical protein